MEDTPQPKICFLRTKRFWFRWAIPGLLLVLWVEGMLFDQAIWFNFYTPSSQTSSKIWVSNGSASGASFQEDYPSGFSSLRRGWSYLRSDFRWSPQAEWFPQLYHFEENAGGCLRSGQIRRINLPLWLPLILWLLIAHLWSRHQKRKQAALHQSSDA
jgi:hypothetical protein